MIFNEIKAKHLELRKNREVGSGFIGYIIGEIENKIDGTDYTDDKVIPILKNVEKKVKENPHDHIDHELDLINSFLPKQLSEQEIRYILAKARINGIGPSMQYLKKNYAGQYDGKVAAKVASET